MGVRPASPTPFGRPPDNFSLNISLVGEFLLFLCVVKMAGVKTIASICEAAVKIPASMPMEEEISLRKMQAMDIHRLERSEIQNGENGTPMGWAGKLKGEPLWSGLG